MKLGPQNEPIYETPEERSALSPVETETTEGPQGEILVLRSATETRTVENDDDVWEDDEEGEARGCPTCGLARKRKRVK